MVVVGYMANNLLPLRIGEVVRSYYVGEREGVSKTAALATILIERLMDALTLIVFVAVIAVFVPLTAVAEGFGGQVEPAVAPARHGGQRAVRSRVRRARGGRLLAGARSGRGGVRAEAPARRGKVAGAGPGGEIHTRAGGPAKPPPPC